MKYLEKYRQVLVTTYREFVLGRLRRRGHGHGTGELLAGDQPRPPSGRWPRTPAQGRRRLRASASPTSCKRALLRQAPIAAPQDLAWFLASYAREARARVEEGGELPALAITRRRSKSRWA